MRNKVVVRMVLVSLLIILALAPFSAAWAAPPESWYWEGSGTDTPLIDCGDFVIDGEWSEWDRGRDFFDMDGNWTGAIVNVHFLGKLTNRETGLTIRDEGYFNVKIDANSSTQMEVGVIWNLNVPGHGVVALDAGNLVWDMTTWEILHEGGPHQVLHGLDVAETLCTYMEG